MDQLTYRNLRPESPKGLVYTAYTNKGREAAEKLGKKFGIARTRLKRWLDRGFVHVRAKPASKAPAEPDAKKKPAEEEGPGRSMSRTVETISMRPYGA